MKTPEELNKLKAEVEALNGKLAELSEDELKTVASGIVEYPGSNGVILVTSENAKNAFAEHASSFIPIIFASDTNQGQLNG